MTVRIERYSGGAEDWNLFVRAQPDWTSFHLFEWKGVLAREFGHECPFLCARDDEGQLVGVLPLVRVRSRLFGHFLMSMPFVNYGGPLGSEGAIQALATAAAEMSASSGVQLLELRSRSMLPVDLEVSHRKITVLLDLPDSAEALRRHIGSKLRSQVKRAEKEGVSVRFGADQVDPFFEVFSRHMRDLGTPTLPRSFFRHLATAFASDVWFGCAWLGDTPIAAGAGFHWRDEFEMTWASSLREHNRISPNMLLYWAFMARSIDCGARIFNFGRCSENSGTHRFKRQWGSRDEKLWWYQRSVGTAGTPSPDDARYSLGPRVWKRLPLPVANLLGPRIVKFIP